MCFKNKLCAEMRLPVQCSNNKALTHTDCASQPVRFNLLLTKQHFGLVSKLFYYHFGHVYVSLHFRTFLPFFFVVVVVMPSRHCIFVMYICTKQFRSIPLNVKYAAKDSYTLSHTNTLISIYTYANLHFY